MKFKTPQWSKTTVMQWLVLISLLGLGFAVRMVNLKDPPLDFHPVRQLRSAIMARGFYYEMNTASDPAIRQAAISLIPQDVHEPPIYEKLVAGTYFVIGSEQLWITRIFSSLFWLIGGLALFSIARRHTSFGAALLGLAFYLVLPFSIVASRSFQPDPWMVMWILLTAWALDHWMETPNWKWTLVCGALGGIAFLVKVMAGLFLVGMLVFAVILTIGFKGLLRNLKPWIMALCVATPAVFYYLVLNPNRSSEYFSFWTVGFIQMIVTTKFYVQWLSMINSLTGLTLLVVSVLGIMIATPRFRVILSGLWLGYAWFGLMWPFQYTTHEYYHLMLIPVIGLSITPVAEVFFRKLSAEKWFWRVAATAVILAAVGFEAYVGRSQLLAHDFSFEPRSWELVGKSIPPGEPFIALTNDYGLRLNYYGLRNATYYWPGQPDLEMGQTRGASGINTAQLFKDVIVGKNYFLVTALNELDAQSELKDILTQNYPVYYQGSGWVVYDLAHPK